MVGVIRPRRAIIGVGNLLYSDEGVGVHVARRLLEGDIPPGVAVWDGGTEGLGLMDAIVGLDRLVIVDCVKAGGAPGTIYRIDWNDLPAEAREEKTSFHQATISDVLENVALVTDPPHTTIIGVEPEHLEFGLELSTVVSAKLDAICRLALNEIQKRSD